VAETPGGSAYGVCIYIRGMRHLCNIYTISIDVRYTGDIHAMYDSTRYTCDTYAIRRRYTCDDMSRYICDMHAIYSAIHRRYTGDIYM
jgi:hypothetical protein